MDPEERTEGVDVMRVRVDLPFLDEAPVWNFLCDAFRRCEYESFFHWVKIEFQGKGLQIVLYHTSALS